MAQVGCAAAVEAQLLRAHAEQPGRRQDKRPGTLRRCKHHGSGSAVGWSSVLFDEGAGHVLGAVRGLEVAFGGGDDGALHQDVARPGEAVGVAQAGGFGAFAQDRSRRRRGRRRSSMAVPFVGSHPERASGISAGYFGQPLPAAMWGLSLGWNAHLLNLDFDPTVVGIASQPFWLHWIDAGQAGLARAGLLRPPKRWLGGGGRLPAGGAAQAAGRREVRGDGTGLRAGGVGVSAAR